MGRNVRTLMLEFDASVEKARREMLRLANDVDQQSDRMVQSAGQAAAALEGIGDGTALAGKGFIAPNPQLAAPAAGRSEKLQVEVMPSPLFVTTTALVTQGAAREEVGSQLARANRPRTRGSFGA